MAKAKNMTQTQVALMQGFRSGLEEKIQKQLTEVGINPKYESVKLKYHISKDCNYTPDFPVTDKIIIETKGRFQTADRMKMLMLQKQYPKIDFRFVFSNSKARISKVSKTTYGKWCENNGFKYADKEIPDKWIEEIKKQQQKEGKVK